jgi:hypothetical protein
MRAVIVGVICVLALSSVASAQELWVAVTTKAPADPTFLTPEERDRRDSVKDFQRALQPRFSVPDSKHPADVTLEVLGRGPDPADGEYLLVRCRLTAGDYEATIIGRDDRWFDAAYDAVKQFQQWAKAHGKELVAKRPPGPKKK